MSSAETVESYLYRAQVPHDQIEDSTWVVQLGDMRESRVIVRIEEPIILFTTPILSLDEDVQNSLDLYRTLLELNADLLHTSYAIEGQRVVLTGAHELVNLDFNEFQAVVDDMTMARDSHKEKLSAWESTPQSAPSDEA